MAENKEALVLQMSADITRMTKALNAVRGQTDRQLKAIEARFDQMSGRVRRSTDDMSRDVRTAISAIAVTAAISSIGKYADAWTTLRNQARQYVDVIGPIEESTRRINAIATDAGVSVESLGTTFAASARAAKALGASGDDVFAFNEAVAKGSAIANTGIAAVDGALVQLGQAIGSPKVQLGEFNSVIEGTPRLAQAFADGITEANGSVAKLRQLIASGEISGGELFQGLISQLPKLRSEFSQTEATLGQSITRLQNAAVEYVGSLDKTYGVTASLAGLINAVASNLDLFANAAVATVAVISGQGLVGALGAVVQRLRDTRDAFDKGAASVREQASVLKKLGQEQAKVALIARDELAIAQASRIVSVEQIAASKDLTLAFRNQEQAVRDVADARGELAVANRAAGASDRVWLSQADDVTVATQRLREAEERLATLRKAAPAEVAAYYSANKQLAEAQLAANVAADNLAKTQKAQSAAQAAAAGSGATFAGVMRGFATFMSGPVGTIALIAALTLGMSALGRSSDSASTLLGRAEDSIRKMNDALGEVKTSQSQLEAVNKRIEDLVKAQGEAARNTADIELAAINERIAKNKELAGLYKDQALAELASARAQQAREFSQQNGRLRGLGTSAPVGPAFQALQKSIQEAAAINAAGGQASSGATIGDLDKLAAAALQEARTAARSGKILSDAQLELLNIATEQAALQAKINALQDAVDGKSATPKEDPKSIITDPAGKSKLHGFNTALEDFNATIKEVSASEEGAAIKSRAAVQALLDYASASKSVAAAIAEIPGLSKLLSPEDADIARAELRKITEQTIAGVQTGFVEIEAERDKALKEANAALRDAMAAGVTDTRFYYEKLTAIQKDYVEKRRKLIDDQLPVEGIASPGDTLGPAFTPEAVAANIKKGWIRDGFLPSEAQEEMQRVMRESVKRALNDGIRTGDWGDSFASILADAVTAGLDKALNTVGNWLADFLFGNNGFLKGVIDGASAWASSNIFGRKAVAGSLSGGRSFLVGENGPEVLRMGSNQTGRLLDAGQTGRLLNGGGRGGGSVYAPLIVNGSVDAVTWPKLEAAMNRQKRQIMSAMPMMVNGVLTDNRIQRRRL